MKYVTLQASLHSINGKWESAWVTSSENVPDSSDPLIDRLFLALDSFT